MATGKYNDVSDHTHAQLHMHIDRNRETKRETKDGEGKKSAI